jgi:hypothetical protein
VTVFCNWVSLFGPQPPNVAICSGGALIALVNEPNYTQPRT